MHPPVQRVDAFSMVHRNVSVIVSYFPPKKGRQAVPQYLQVKDNSVLKRLKNEQ